MSSKDICRRDFIKSGAKATAAVIGFPYFVNASALGKDGNIAPSNKVVVGCIGVGNQGSGVMRGGFLTQDIARVVAVCDVKSDRRKSAKQTVDRKYGDSGCREYHDFRELLARDDIDAVLIASTDHWHVLHAIAAAKAKKDIYLEKPMGMSIEQDQALRSICKRQGTVFQFGTQQRSGRNFRYACELVRNEKIGKLHTINVLSPPSIAGGSLKPAAVPETIDYNFWLGPAPYSPYTENRCSNKLWWFHSDYALGWIAGWGVHPLDIALWGGGDLTTGDITLEGWGSFPAEGFCDTATAWKILIEYKSGIKINYVGGKQPEEWRKRYGRDQHGIGFEGTDGWVHVNRGRVTAHPESLLKEVFTLNDLRLPESNHHGRNFLECVKTREKTVCHIDAATDADFLCQLSDITIRRGEKITWDSKKEKIIGNENADRMTRRAMRVPWHL